MSDVRGWHATTAFPSDEIMPTRRLVQRGDHRQATPGKGVDQDVARFAFSEQIEVAAASTAEERTHREDEDLVSAVGVQVYSAIDVSCPAVGADTRTGVVRYLRPLGLFG